MFRCLLVPALAVFALPAFAQDMSQLFGERTHDFGTVARAAKAEYEFRFKNTTNQTLHLAGVRTSCGCTTPKIVRNTVKPGEFGGIISVLNTSTHIGQRAATITVTFDSPHYTEVQLQIRAYVRQDIVIHPGQVKFGSIEPGKPIEQIVEVNYAGREDWKLLAAKPSDASLQAEIQETQRAGGRVSYRVLVKLNPSAKPGYINEQVTLVTNDRRASSQQIPLLVEGRIVAPLTVTPSPLYLGDVEPGQKITRQLAIRGHQPFKVLGVEAPSGADGFTFQVAEQEAALHLITVTFTPSEPGKFEQKLRIATDLAGSEAIHCTVLGTVKDVAKLQ